MQKDIMRALINEGIEETKAREKSERIVRQARAFRKAKGSETPASASLRKAINRYLDDREAATQALMSPTQDDPISYPITMLSRLYASPPPMNEEEEKQRMSERLSYLEGLIDALRLYPTETKN